MSFMKAWIAANPSEWERSRWKSHLKKRYGITVERYNQILLDQGNVCAICSGPPGDSRGYRPHLDHCHVTGKVRGILCGRCNNGLGNFCDDSAIMLAAIAYLEKHRGTDTSNQEP